MKRLSLITIMISFFTLAAHAQVATPYLDASAHTKGPAAVGWRYAGIVSGYIGTTTDSKASNNVNSAQSLKEVGTVEKSGDVPPITAAYRGENLGAELYYATGMATTADISAKFDAAYPDAATTTLKTVETVDDMRVNLAWVFGEILSVGLGYRAETVITEEDSSIYLPPAVLDASFAPFAALDPIMSMTVDSEETESRTVTSVMVSWRLMEMIYLAGGIENETQSWKSKGTRSFVAVNNGFSQTQNLASESVEASWQNTVLGVGLIVGEPDDSQFRVEYALNKSPETKVDASGSKSGFAHRATDITYTSVEAKFGGVLVTYQATKEEKKKNDDINEDKTDEDTIIGAGWAPMEGLNVMAYMVTSKQTRKSPTDEVVLEGNGFALTASYAF